MTVRRWVLGTACGLTALSLAPAADWPQWRGPSRDNKVADFAVPAMWPKTLTKKWKETVGEGVACPVLAGDKVYAFGRVGGDEVVTCLNAETGKSVWSDKYAVAFRPSADSGYPGPRATPAVGEGKLVTLGVNGTLSCYDAAEGKRLWQKGGTVFPRFHTSASPIIVDGMAVVFLGKDGAGELTAFDLKSGDVKWKWTEEGTRYGSPVLMTVDGTKMVVTLAQQSLVGVGLADGKTLWKVAFKGNYQSGTPIVDGATVYCTTPEQGTVALKIEKSGDEFKANELWKKPKAAGTYNTPVLKDGLLYGLGGATRPAAPPAGGGGGGGQRGGRGGRGGGMGGGMGGGGPMFFYCMDAKTGDVKWTDDQDRGQCGGIFDAGSVLLALSAKSELVVFKPEGKGFEQITKYKVADTPTWALPIITGKRIFVKDKDSVILWTVE